MSCFCCCGCDIYGVLLLDKLQGMFSNDVLQKVKCIYNVNCVGYIGVLDLLVIGMLLICFGEVIKFLQYLLDFDKCYCVIVCLGQCMDIFDVDG